MGLLSKDQTLIAQKFQNQIISVGEADLTTVHSANRGDSKLYVVTAKVKGSDTKKFVLYVDERGAQPLYARFILDTNIPEGTKESDGKNFTGYVKFISLLNAKHSTYVYFDHGTQTVDGRKLSAGKSEVVATNFINPDDNSQLIPEDVADQTADEISIGLDSKLTKCIRGVMRDMTFGQWCVFVITEPDSVALVILGCAIDVVVHPENY